MSITKRLAVPSYDELLFQFIVGAEGFRDHVYTDSVGVPTIGYGMALIHETSSGWKVVDVTNATDWPTSLPDLSQNDKDTLRDVALILNNPNLTTAEKVAAARELIPGPDSSTNVFSFSVTEAQATELFLAKVTEKSNYIRTRLGSTAYNSLVGSQEMAALVSLAYNVNSLIGNDLIAAIQNGDRAEAWYQIRYQSNGGDNPSQGIANRRYHESDLFSLYKRAP